MHGKKKKGLGGGGYKAGGEKYYKSGGSLKAIPKGNKGLGMLPTEVRNNMGYMKGGGEKLLKKMAMGGQSIDLVDMMMYGGAMKKKQYNMGGRTNGSRTYSG